MNQPAQQPQSNRHNFSVFSRVEWVLTFVLIVAFVWLYFVSQSRVEVNSEQLSPTDSRYDDDLSELGSSLGVSFSRAQHQPIGYADEDKLTYGLSTVMVRHESDSQFAPGGDRNSHRSRYLEWSAILERSGYKRIVDTDQNDTMRGYLDDEIYCQLELAEATIENSGEAFIGCAGIGELERQTMWSELLASRDNSSIEPTLHDINQQSATQRGVWQRASGTSYPLTLNQDFLVPIDELVSANHYYRRVNQDYWSFGFSGYDLPDCAAFNGSESKDIQAALADFGCKNGDQAMTIGDYARR